MTKVKLIVSILIFLSGYVVGTKGFEGRPITTNVSMPTGFTVYKGEFLVGIGPISFGISDNLQVGTNILMYIFQDYNANFKLSLFRNKEKALAAGIKLHQYELEVFGSDSGFTSISPFAVFSFNLTQNTTFHIGGQYSFFSGEEDIEYAVATFNSSGTSVNTGIEYSFSNKTKFLAETGYDFTFEGFRIGGAVLFGRKKFRIKLGVNYFNPQYSKAYIFPVVSLWWRFKG